MSTTISPSTGQGALLLQAGPGASPGYGAIDLRRAALIGLQEGVLAASSFEVTQRGAGVAMSVDIAATTADSLGTGIAAVIQGDAVTAQGLYPVPPHNAVINETVTANASGNPRIDRVVLELKDNTHDASGSNLVQTRLIAGTATSGATLNNLTGAAAVPSSALLLADVLVASGAASIANSVIRDRRKWARGVYSRTVRNSNAAGGNNYSVSSSTYALLDSTNLAPRIECSGAPVRVRLAAGLSTSSAGTQVHFSPQVDSAGVDGMGSVGATALANGIVLAAPAASAFNWAYWEHVFIPSAGSHVIAPAVGGVAAFTLAAQAALPIRWEVEEIIRQNTANNGTTTG